MPTFQHPDSTGLMQSRSVRGRVICSAEARPIHLLQQSKRRFAVVYGLEVREGLSYGEAAGRYGEALLHALCCEGLIDFD